MPALEFIHALRPYVATWREAHGMHYFTLGTVIKGKAYVTKYKQPIHAPLPNPKDFLAYFQSLLPKEILDA